MLHRRRTAPSRRSVLRSLAAGFGVLALDANSSKANIRGKDTLVFALDSITGNADPGMFVTFGDTMSIDCMGRGLTHIDFHSLHPRPAIAESWEVSPNGTTYTFRLRRGLRFHDGTRVTAHDCQRTFARLMQPNDPSRPPGVYAIDELGGANLLAVETADSYTLQMKLARPDAGFAGRLSRPNAVILSAAALDRLGPAIGRQLVSCGPFQFVESEPGERVVLEAFPGFYEGTPAVRRLVLQVMPDALAVVMALRAGEVQLSNCVPHSALPYLRKKASVRVYDPRPFITVFMAMNVQTTPLNDIRVRRAINYSIDRKAIIHEAFLDSAGQPAYMITPAQQGYEQALTTFSTKNLTLAREQLRQSGLLPGSKLRLLCRNHLFWPSVGQIVQRGLNELGFDVFTEYVDEGTFSGKIVDPDAHQLYLDQRSAFVPDANDKFTALFASGERAAELGTRHTHLPTQPKLDAMLTAAGQTSQESARLAIYREINRYLAEEVMAHAALAYIAAPVAGAAQLSGVNADALGTYRTFLEGLNYAG